MDIKKLIINSQTHHDFLKTVDLITKKNARKRSKYTEPLLRFHFETDPTFKHLKPKYYNFGSDKLPYQLKKRIPFLSNFVSGDNTPYIDGCLYFEANKEIWSVSKKTRDNRKKDKIAKGKLPLEEARFSRDEGFNGHIHSSSEQFISQKPYIQKSLKKFGSNFLWIPDSLIEKNWKNIQNSLCGINTSTWKPTTWRSDILGLNYMQKEGERIFYEKKNFFSLGSSAIWKNQWIWETGVGKTTPIVLGLEYDFLNIFPLVKQKIFIGELVNPRNKACNQNLKATLEHFTTQGHPIEMVLLSGPSTAELFDILEEDGTDFSDLPIKKFTNELTFKQYVNDAIKNNKNFIVHRNYHSNKITKKVFETLGVKSFVWCDEYHWTTLPPTQTFGIMNGPYPLFSKEGLTGTERGRYDLPKKYQKLNFGQDVEKHMGKIRSHINHNLAVKLGYIPDFRNVIPSFDKNFMEQTFGSDWKKIYENNEYIKPSHAKKYNNLTLTIDGYINFQNIIEMMDQDIGHCAIHKCFTIEHCKEEERNFKAILSDLIKYKKNTKNYNRLTNIVTYVADTHSKDKRRIWSEVNDILHEADDKKQFVIIFFSELLLESWSPKPDGIIDIESFGVNVRSTLKFRQVKGRGNRQGHKNLYFNKRYNNVTYPMFRVTDDEEFNENHFYKNLYDYCKYTKEDPDQLWEKSIILQTSTTKKKKNRKKRKANTVKPTQTVVNIIKLRKWAKQIKEVWNDVKLKEKYTNMLFNDLFTTYKNLSRTKKNIQDGVFKKYVVKNIKSLSKKYKKILTGIRLPDVKSQVNKVMRIVWGLDNFLYPENLNQANAFKEKHKSDTEEYNLKYQNILYELFKKYFKNKNFIPMGSLNGNADATQSIFSPVQKEIQKLKQQYGYVDDYNNNSEFCKKNKKLWSDQNKVIQFQQNRWHKYTKELANIIEKILDHLPSFPVGQIYDHPLIKKLNLKYPITEKQFLDTIKTYLYQNKNRVHQKQIRNTILLIKEFYKNFASYRGTSQDCFLDTIKKYKKKNKIVKTLDIETQNRVICYNHKVVSIVPGEKLELALSQRVFDKIRNQSISKRVNAGLQRADNTGKGKKIFCLGKVYDSITLLQKAKITIPKKYRNDPPVKIQWKSHGKTGYAVRRRKSGQKKFSYTLLSREKIFKVIKDSKNKAWIRYV